MENKKMTKKDFYKNFMAKYPLTEDEVKFCEHEIELLDKKNASASSKPTATQTANEAIKAEILVFMGDNEKRTVTEIMKGVPSLNGASNQKATALVRQLADENDPNAPMKREVIKGKAFFSLR